MRNFLCLAKDASSKATSVAENKALRGLLRNKSQREEIKSSINLAWQEKQTKIIEPATTFNIPAPEMNEFGIRVAKGLLFHHQRDVIYKDYDFKITPMQPKNPDDIFNFPFLLKEFEIDPEVFRYRIGIDEENPVPKGAMVYCEFYRAVSFAVFGKCSN